VNFTDKVLVRLADRATWTAVFDGDALEQFIASTYDASRVTVQAPFSAVFDELVDGGAGYDQAWELLVREYLAPPSNT
jgi:hypothetical protein